MRATCAASGWDAGPRDETYIVDYAYLLRQADGSVSVEHDRHLEGLFWRDDWLRLLSQVGFEARTRPWEPSDADPCTHEILVAVKPT